MPRYFLEVSYKGTAYSGFQSQHNAHTVQAEIEKAFQVLYRPGAGEQEVKFTGSSRTDTGVHALQNYFHFDTGTTVENWKGIETEAQFVYKMNAILPDDIVIRKLQRVSQDAHCRFDAISREYKYFIYRRKDPFLKDRAFYFPYKLDWNIMQEAASLVPTYHDFTSFSKRNTQVKTFQCQVKISEWVHEDDTIVYRVKANRFLRGMVRALTATMLKLGRGKLTIGDFKRIIESRDCNLASFAVPPQGLFLVSVEYPDDQFTF